MPLECAYCPVSRQARLAEHVDAAQNALRKSIPCSASPWIRGVRTAYPYGATCLPVSCECR